MLALLAVNHAVALLTALIRQLYQWTKVCRRKIRDFTHGLDRDGVPMRSRRNAELSDLARHPTQSEFSTSLMDDSITSETTASVPTQLIQSDQDSERD